MLDTKNPAPLAAGRVSNGFVDFQPTPVHIADNRLDLNHFRARHLARRYRLTPIAAGVVAELVFAEARR
jgi:hypothetical protein